MWFLVFLCYSSSWCHSSAYIWRTRLPFEMNAYYKPYLSKLMIWSRLAFFYKNHKKKFTPKILIIRINMYNQWYFFHLKSSKMLKGKRWQNYVHLNIISSWPKKQMRWSWARDFLSLGFPKEKAFENGVKPPKKTHIWVKFHPPKKKSVKNVDWGWSFFHWNQATKLDLQFGHGLKLLGQERSCNVNGLVKLGRRFVGRGL